MCMFEGKDWGVSGSSDAERGAPAPGGRHAGGCGCGGRAAGAHVTGGAEGVLEDRPEEGGQGRAPGEVREGVLQARLARRG